MPEIIEDLETGERNAVRQAAERVARLSGARLEPGPLAVCDLLNRPGYIFRDTSGREYLVRPSARDRGLLVDVRIPVGRGRRRFLRPMRRRFLVRDRLVFCYADFQLVADYLEFFFQRRQYPVSRIEWKAALDLPFLKKAQGRIFSGEHRAVFTVHAFRGRFRVRLRDASGGPSFFCSPRSEYVFSFRGRVPVRSERLSPEKLLESYGESEITVSIFSPFALARRALFGFKSENLRAFYSRDGILPEVRHAVMTTFFYTMAGSLVNASVFVRVAERLMGNTWYVLAAGVLVFLRIPAEVVNVRRSMRITRDLPSPRLRKISRSEAFRATFETRPFRLWRSFERVLLDLFRGGEQFSEKLEQYRLLKPDLFRLAQSGRRQEIPAMLVESLGLEAGAARGAGALALKLEPIDVEQVRGVFGNQVLKLKRADLLRPSEWKTMDDFVSGLPQMLERYTVDNVIGSFNDILKRAERAPNRRELEALLGGCRKAALPFRRADLLLLLSFFIIGYGASYAPGMAIIVFPLFYIFHGLMVQLIASGLERFTSPVWMQYVYKELENDPAVPSAADVWNEFNSQLMRLFTLATSLGIIIGLSGRLLAGPTRNISWFGAEALALVLHLAGLRAWFAFFGGLQHRCRGDG